MPIKQRNKNWEEYQKVLTGGVKHFSLFFLIFSFIKKMHFKLPPFNNNDNNNNSWRTWKLAEMWRPSKPQHYWEQTEYWEESWRFEETCCHSNSREKPSAKADVKNSQGVKKMWIMIWLVGWSIRNCARNWNFTILTNKKLFLKVKRIKFS